MYEEILMDSTTQYADDDLVLAVEDIAAVRSRAEQPSDGGSTGRGDTNDNGLY